MPTLDPRVAVTLGEARDHLRRRTFEPTPGDGRIGLEIEFFAITVDDRGRPVARTRLKGAGGLIERLDELVGSLEWLGASELRGGNPYYPVEGGGYLSFEPGAQLEYSTAPLDGAAAAMESVERIVRDLRPALAGRSIVLASTGVDLWTDVATVPQQLEGARYPAMATYLQRICSAGATMMRHTASTQINLDLGDPEAGRERWMVANLVSPLLTATFAASPVQDGVSARTRAWQRLDPTRTGFPPGLVDGDDTPKAYVDAALAANVLLFRTSAGGAVPGRPGFTLADWIAHGHPVHGRPTLDDLDYHLTTLFFEVRPRGFLEIRSVEGLPDPWRAVPVVLMAGLLYDPVARRRVLDLIRPMTASLPRLWLNAARVGVRDLELRRLAVAAWRTALDGASRLGSPAVRGHDLEAVASFIERFPGRGHMPADEYAAAFATGPACALRWAEDGETGLRPILVDGVAGC